MSSKTCVSCLRTLGNQSRRLAKKQTFISPRSFSVSICRGAVPLPEPNQGPATSMPPVTPEIAPKSSKPLSTIGGTPMPRLDAAALKKLVGKSAETYTAYGSTEILYKYCAQQATYTVHRSEDEEADPPKTEDGEDLGVGEGWWHTELGLKPTFSTWSQVTMLHMYLLSARFRAFKAASATPWQQHLLDHFFYDAENRMVINHNMHARGTRNRYLKDMFIQWRGLLAAYDEGLAKGDAVLAAAVWRNVFKADENVDVTKLAQIVSYMRKALRDLEGAQDEMFYHANLNFGSPRDEKNAVSTKSQSMDLPFDIPGGGAQEKKEGPFPAAGKVGVKKG